MRYGERIKRFRTERKMRQHQLGALLGVTAQAISKWETNRAEPDSENIRQLCTVFNTDANKLLGIESSALTPYESCMLALFGDSTVSLTNDEFEEIKRYAKYIRWIRHHE